MDVVFASGFSGVLNLGITLKKKAFQESVLTASSVLFSRNKRANLKNDKFRWKTKQIHVKYHQKL